jgi:hypothetical protein
VAFCRGLSALAVIFGVLAFAIIAALLDGLVYCGAKNRPFGRVDLDFADLFLLHLDKLATAIVHDGDARCTFAEDRIAFGRDNPL